MAYPALIIRKGNIYIFMSTHLKKQFQKILKCSKHKYMYPHPKLLHFDVFLIKSQDVPNSITERPSQPPTVTATDTDFKTIEIEKKILTMNALTYVSGYLLMKCLTKHDCTSCNSILTSEYIDDSSQLFTMFKEFDGCKLTIPKDSFVKHILQMEDVFVNIFNNNIEKANISQYLCSSMPKLVSMVKCQYFPHRYLIELFIRMRLHYALKFGNQELVSKKKKNRKYIKVQHL